MPPDTCCAECRFALVSELGHAESLDWDLGRCRNCATPLLRTSAEYSPAVVYHPLTAVEAEAFVRAEGRARKMLLKAWFEDH